MYQRASLRIGLCLALAATALAHAGEPVPAAVGRQLREQLAGFAQAHPAIPGAAAAVIGPGGETRWSAAVGLADRGSGQALRPQQPFRIASVTKLYTAAAVLVLAERGRLDLEQGIARYIAADTATRLRSAGYDPDAILVRHLLAHTSGLPDYAQIDAYRVAVMADPQHKWLRTEQIELALRENPAVGAPGERFAYSDTGYVILGEILERATGRPLDAALQELLALQRRGLSHTRMERDGDAAAPDFAHAYLGELDTALIDASFDLHGGGGLLSNVDDLAGFLRMAYRGELFDSAATLAAALAIAPTAQAESHAYALMGAPQVLGRHLCWGHTGFWGTYAFHCPAADVTVVLTVNASVDGLPVRPWLGGLIDTVTATPAVAR